MKAMQMQMDLGGTTYGRARRDHDEFIAARLAESPTGETRLSESGAHYRRTQQSASGLGGILPHRPRHHAGQNAGPLDQTMVF